MNVVAEMIWRNINHVYFMHTIIMFTTYTMYIVNVILFGRHLGLPLNLNLAKPWTGSNYSHNIKNWECSPSIMVTLLPYRSSCHTGHLIIQVTAIKVPMQLS